MTTLKAVLWDMDGVLIDSEQLVMEIFVDLMRTTGEITNPAEVYMQTIGLNRKATLELYLQYLPDANRVEQIFEQVKEAYNARVDDELTLKPGVESALAAVAEVGLPQMVVTSTYFDAAVSKLSQFSLMPYFVAVVGGDQVVQGKPYPEPYLKACAQLKLAPADALVVEDSANGVKAARAAGCQVMHVPDLIQAHPNWSVDIDYSLASLLSFPAWLAQQELATPPGARH